MEHRQQRNSLLAVALLCLLVSLIDQTQASNEPSLEALCNDKQVSLTRISTVRKLIDENRAESRQSCAKYADSIAALDDILATVQTGKTCDLAFVDKIRKYHERFLANSSGGIPKPLRHFFISLCFQISAECKMALINNLEYDTKDKLIEADYEQIRFLEAHGATLLDQDTEIKDFDDILLLDDLSEASGLENEIGQSKLLIKVRTNKMMRNLVENCNKKFKPFYDKLILPLIKLSNLGYNYQGELLEREMEELRQNRLVLRWYNIVQTCEAFRSIEIYEDPEPLELNDGVQALTFITKEMAESLRKRNVKTIEQEIAEEEARRGADPGISYEPIASHNDDELWIKDQKELEKLVHKYKASVSEAERVKSRLFKKIISKVKEMIFSGQIPLLVTEMVKNGFGKEEKKTTSLNDDLVLLMDEAVREQEIKSGHVSSEDMEGAVAGISSRKVVSRAGPKLNVKNMALPSRTKLVPFVKDGTKKTTKLFHFGAKFLPNRMNILFWILAICGTLMIFISVFGSVVG